jgi:hypothetical protein
MRGGMETDDEAEAPARKCERCGADMKFVAALPRVGGLPRLNTFRCMQCDNIATEPAS